MQEILYTALLREREAGSLSWLCYNINKPPEDIKKAAKMRKSATAKAKLPKSSTIKKWFQKINNKIRLLTNVTIEDTNVMKELQKLSPHEDNESDFESYLLYSY